MSTWAMAQRIAVWNGSTEAMKALRRAVDRNCECDSEMSFTCAGHAMLSDQSILNHLAFVWKVRMAYVRGEFDPIGEWF